MERLRELEAELPLELGLRRLREEPVAELDREEPELRDEPELFDRDEPDVERDELPLDRDDVDRDDVERDDVERDAERVEPPVERERLELVRRRVAVAR